MRFGSFKSRTVRAHGSEAEEVEGLAQTIQTLLASKFDNPDRVGCPSQDFLWKLAKFGATAEMLRPWARHLSSCGECYRDFIKLRSEHGLFYQIVRRLFQWVLRTKSKLCLPFSRQTYSLLDKELL